MDNPLNDRRSQAAHLLRRAGFGGTSAEIDRLAALSHPAAVEKMLDVRPIGKAFNLPPNATNNNIQADLYDIGYWWYLTMVYTRQPLQEKMTLFLHGHFATVYNKVNDVVLMLKQNELFRENCLGNFKELVKKVARDPAMLLFLDGQYNRKGKPNENWAREMLELFTIGIGNYTEQDVREAARAFTGWGFKDGQFLFTAAYHDTGPKTFMGQTGNFDGDDIIDIIFSQRQTARNITTKLWNFLVYRNPDPAIIEALSDTFIRSNFSLKEVLRAIFLHPEFLSARAYRALVKSPVEYLVGLLKHLGVGSFDTAIPRYSANLGQFLFNPPDVKGWDGNLDWLNSSSFFERVNTANTIAINRGTGSLPYSPYNLLDGALNDAQAVVDRLVNVLLDGQTDGGVRAALVEYLNGGQNPGPAQFGAALAGKNEGKALDARVRGTVHLVASTLDYMLN